jgi:hypothetical protein
MIDLPDPKSINTIDQLERHMVRQALKKLLRDKADGITAITYEMLLEGCTTAEIHRVLGIPRATLQYHIDKIRGAAREL